jgi:drug/metabolite transporter (DMT)-like permease
VSSPLDQVDDVAAEPASSARVWGAIWIVYVVWGSTYLAIAMTIGSMPPMVALATRFLLAAMLLGGYLMIRRGPRHLAVPWRQIRGAAIIGTLLLGVGIGNVTLAERYVPSGVVALLVAVVPLWVVLLRTLTGDRPPLVTWLGVGLGLVGVAVLVLPGDHVASLGGASPTERALWSLAVVGGSACWAFGSFIQPRIAVPRDPLVLTTYEMIVGGLILLARGFLRGEHVGDMAGASARSWLGWGYLVIVGSIVAYTAYVWVLGHAPLSLVTTYAYVNPVVAVALGWCFNAEPLTIGVLLGGAIVVSGVVLVVSGERLGRSRG